MGRKVPWVGRQVNRITLLDKVIPPDKQKTVRGKVAVAK